MADLAVELIPWQQKAWQDNHRFQVIPAGRRSGKTRYACLQLLVRGLSSTSGSVFYVAPTQGQARDIIWDLLHELGQSVISSSHVNNLQITLINGSKISLKGADRPETMRGISLAYLVLDEYADMKPEVWEQILRPALSDLKGDALFIGTPMGRNHFYDLYKYAELGNDPEWQAYHLTSYDNPFLDPDEIENAKKSMSSYAFRQEYMASFEAVGSEMFQEEWIKFGEEPEVGDYFIACDLAGFEETNKRTKSTRLDDTAIAVVKVSTDGWFVKEIITGRWDLNTTAEKIFNAVHKYQPISVGIELGIARQAVMSPLNDMMRRSGRFFRVEELRHGNKKKTDRIMWALQGRFENGYITLEKGEWNIKFLDQLYQFPDRLTHDDTVDALAYIDQLQQVTYHADIEIDDFEYLDEVAGY